MHGKGHKARYTFADYLGESAAMREAISRAVRISSTDRPLLIYGETGTGKEIIAQSVHNVSRRRNNPFVAVNCASLTENLLESELFGYVEGAFTGARRGGKPGLFEIANRGSIFLDEVSEIPLSLQARLLRVLQENEVMRLGHDRVIPVDVRLIAASNKDLEAMVRAGFFRQDLFYRLNVLSLRLPPLRERPGDIGLLARHFLSESGSRTERLEIVMTPEALSLLEEYDWPGNVRELRNVCERLQVFASDPKIKAEDLLRVLDIPGRIRPRRLPRSARPTAADVHNALRKASGHHGQAAAALGMSRTTLWRRLREEKKTPV
jgi:transcriptional regulator with PAS, ATPase and Fis domain